MSLGKINTTHRIAFSPVTSERIRGRFAYATCSVVISPRPFCALECGEFLWAIIDPILSERSVDILNTALLGGKEKMKRASVL